MIKIGPVQECTKVVKRRDYLSTAYDYKNSKKKKKNFFNHDDEIHRKYMKYIDRLIIIN